MTTIFKSQEQQQNSSQKNQQSRVIILLIGHSGAGESSFLNAIMSYNILKSLKPGHNIFESLKPNQLEEKVEPFCLGWKKKLWQYEGFKGWKKDSQKKLKIQNSPNIKKNVKVQKIPSFKKGKDFFDVLNKMQSIVF